MLLHRLNGDGISSDSTTIRRGQSKTWSLQLHITDTAKTLQADAVSGVTIEGRFGSSGGWTDLETGLAMSGGVLGMNAIQLRVTTPAGTTIEEKAIVLRAV